MFKFVRLHVNFTADLSCKCRKLRYLKQQSKINDLNYNET